MFVLTVDVGLHYRFLTQHENLIGRRELNYGVMTLEISLLDNSGQLNCPVSLFACVTGVSP